ncbi:hypothetical protein [Halothiobacillus diazotrophicus]|nr:hypothetical protein [Halothiobacillus diazotrophicus]
MSIESQILDISIIAMVGIIAVPTYVFLWFWYKSGKAMKEKHLH